MINWGDKTLIAAAAAVLIAGFGVGFLTDHALSGGKSGKTTATASATADGDPLTPYTGLFGKPRDKNAPRAGQAKPADFAVWKQNLDTSGNTPKACIEMSRPLDPSKPYGDYVVVSPALPSAPAISVKDDTLCVSGFGFSDRRITLLKGLPAKNGDTLSANADLDFSVGTQPPYVGFAGNGVVLPREDGDGVAIETVNVSSLAVEVWRVSDRNLVRKSVAAPDPVAEGEYDYSWGDDSADDIGVKIWTGKLPVKMQNGQRVTTVFPLGAVLKTLQPGAYIVKARDASGGRDKKPDDQPAQARRWILYTDMAMMTYKGPNGLDVVMRSLKTAKPMGGVRVDLVATNGEALGSATTDSDGHAAFAGALLKGTDALTAKMVMAYGPNNDYTASDITRAPMDLSSHAIGGRQEGESGNGRASAFGVDSYLYTDRGIYRPGETVHLVALMRDPQGRVIKDRKGALVVYRPSGVEAFRYAFAATPQGFAGKNITLPKSAPRGQWTAKVLLDGMDDPAGSAAFAVEDFAPQRLGVDIDAGQNQPITGLDQTRPVTVTAHYLYGAIGSGLQVTGEARISADPTPFDAYKAYTFGDDSQPYQEKYVDLPATTTDGQGKAVFPFKASEAGDTTQPLSVLLTASVFEPGGRPVKESQTLKILPSPLYLGVKVDQKETKNWRDTPQMMFNIVGLTPQGAKVAVKGVHVRLISEVYDYDWYVENGRWNWRRTHRDVLISDKVMDLNINTGLTFARGLDWGDYRIEVEAPGLAKTVDRFSAGWGGSDQSENGAPDFVRLSLGSKTYKQGDTVELTLKGPYKGEAQVAVASDHIIDLKTVSVGDNGTTVRLKTSADWGGGAYVLVSLMQPRDPVASPKPRRAIGLIYVPLDPGPRKLDVELPVSDQPQPPKRDAHGHSYIEVPIQVKGVRFGEKARVSVAVVDQGILNLTKFAAPDPVKWYFGKRALGVDYNDDYGRLLDPNLGAASPLEFGADEIGGEGLTTTPIRTVALWSGVLDLGSDGKATLRLPIDKFSGELRVMAVAWTDSGVGSAQAKMIVREPVVADLSLPRFLAPGDTATATLELDNVDGKPGLYQAVIKGLNGLAVAFEKMFHLNHGDRAIEGVAIHAPQTTGVSTVKLNIDGQGYHFDDSFNIQTRNGWGPVTRVDVASQKVGEVWTPPANLLNGYQPGSATVQVSYSPFRNIDPGPLAAALNVYPYGCTEQVTSAAMPWLFVSESLVGKARAAPADAALQQAVTKILDRQSANGAFGLWRAGDGEADGFIGAYATDFLLEARARGVFVPQDAIDKALNAMRDLSKPDGYTSLNYRLSVPDEWHWLGASGEQITKQMRSRASAYALYVLAKAHSGDLARLRWYQDAQFKDEQSPLARAQVAAGLAMMGDKARARLAFTQAIQTLGYADPNDWYQSPLRDLAGVIALAYESGFDDIARSLVPRLENAMKSPADMNTQEDAAVLRAASYMLKASGVPKLDAQGVSALPGPGLHYGLGALSAAHIRNSGSGPIWRTVTVIGTPAQSPAADSHGLSLSKTYYSLDGSRLDPSHVTQGARVIVVITGRSDRAEERPIVVDDPLPAGFEIDSVLSAEDAQNGPFGFIGKISDLKVSEARDDRYVAALDVSSDHGFTLAYIARAVTPGDYYLPGAEAKDFYRADTFARTSGARTSIAPR